MKSLVVIPTYNEHQNLARLLDRLQTGGDLEVLFVDDNSTDGTREEIRRFAGIHQGIHLMERPRKMGLGTAYIDGFKWALARSYDLIFEMDADLSHDPGEIPNFIDRIQGGADLVVGSRYVDGIRVINWPLGRLMLSLVAAKYTHFWTGLPLTDPTSGFKCFRRRVLESIDLDHIRSNGYAFQIEMDFCAWRKGFHLAEIPIIFTDRTHGATKMNSKIVREAVCIVPMLRFMHRR
ncbi:MAG: polyprenol monophosphomannose synthase [Verrucomicrobiae bacterium]|nr:polyprenol monophosphomannose synthase [Verrucomicrobiae bacterium]